MWPLGVVLCLEIGVDRVHGVTGGLVMSKGALEQGGGV